ncbi:Thoeris anti-defense Tad2 family protein [Fructilactobacillus fructivorans]|uniref:DUF2829 domain-containing protein n=1 Tax=Fructilactobacillus fructivorans TaxID=1614 RepID=A0AAE6TXY6_9LACO|nr:MW1434 family type I TA system toxin [Fructilactobacillus fructivorans]KRK58481.1 hypothetical protein FC73_GL000032 [Fructilactobacillus fructivorans]KRN13323.1 hypothetical protein IV37_GL000035 [Fructilactobacillus fructivorans]KRN40031.1 hypothetical protein IV51_GL000209 [Fructilactobacillus fructivorans]QFX92490.1 DUF2829 domain-containing protein [Fructilactobacillus fructivorans]RDV65914.1 DUF2829 domain-containing protein [Fructilactobacillus fructivorans]
MNIQEASKKAMSKGLLITRRKWQPGGMSIIPTNTSLCCLMIPYKSDDIDGPSIRWNPTLNDLTADDWIIG